MDERDIIRAAKKDRARCPYCGKLLPGRYPNGVHGALLICRNSRCPSGGREIQIDIPAAQRLPQSSAH